MPGVARWKCVRRCHCRYTTLTQLLQEYGAAARRRSKSLRGSERRSQQQISTSPGCALAAVFDTVKPRRLQIIQIEIVTMPPPVVVPVKIRHINPRQMIASRTA